MLALVTCSGAVDRDTDLPLLQRELPEARVLIWDDPSVDWAAFDVVVVRSTWDYHERRDDVRAWARHVESVSNLWNPLELIEWNTDKRYLLDLHRAGIPIVDSELIAPGEVFEGVIELSGDLVVKPSIGAGSNGVIRTRGDEDLARSHISALHARGLTAMVQPYVAQVDVAGETGLVFLGGKYSHAFEKAAILARPVSFEGGLFAEEQVGPREADPVEIAIGEQVVAHLPPTAYARIDLLPTATGPVVLEVEVTEPSLYLDCDEGAPARAAAVFRSLAP